MSRAPPEPGMSLEEAIGAACGKIIEELNAALAAAQAEHLQCPICGDGRLVLHRWSEKELQHHACDKCGAYCALPSDVDTNLIHKLRSDLAAAQAENAKLVDASVRDLVTEVEHWQAEAARNAQDAARYRYIRETHWAFGEPETDGTFSWKLAFHGCAEHLASEEAMDVAIDAAIAALSAAGKTQS